MLVATDKLTTKQLEGRPVDLCINDSGLLCSMHPVPRLITKCAEVGRQLSMRARESDEG